MQKKLLISIIACVTSLFAFSQVATTTSSYTLRGAGESRDISSFNEAGVKINITTAALENEKIGITIEKPGDKDYKLYLFDEVALKKYPFNVKNYRDFFGWTRNFIDLAFKPNTFDIRFDGIYIDYSEPTLSRTPWSKNGYYGFELETGENFDSYMVKTDELDENSELKITYVFLVTEPGKNEVLIGLTQPLVHTIPQKIIESFLPKEEEEEVAPEQPEKENPVAKWDKKTEEIQISFKDKTSYEEIARDKELNEIYEGHNYGAEIDRYITEIKNELAGERYRTDRERLLDFFTRYQKKELPAEPEEISAEQEEPADTPTAKEEQPKKRREPVDPCTGLKQQFNRINNGANRLTREMSLFNNKITEGISDLRLQLDECSENACFAEVKNVFDEKGWDEELVQFETRLNELSMNLSTLEQNENFAGCQITTQKTTDKLDDIRDEHQRLAEELSGLRIEIESNLINREAFNKTVTAYEEEAGKIISDFESYEEVYIAHDNKLFNTGTLKKKDIRFLEDISEQTDSVIPKIEHLIEMAEGYYNELTNNIGYFPEETFKQETGLQISENDCKFLRANLDNLILRAEKTKRGYGTEIIFGIIILLLLIGGYSYFMGMMKRKMNTRKQKQTNSGNVSSVPVTASEESQQGGIEIIDDDEEINKGKGLDMVRKLAGIKYYEVDVQSFIADTAVRKVYYSKDFVINAYRYFEDKMLHMGNQSIEDLYEYGGFIVGKWDYSLYDKTQYDISLDFFIEPGEDARFSKFNIDFGYDISFRMEEMLFEYAQNGDEHVFTGWLHSHPGHNVFLSNYDIEVQETFRNHHHPNRHVALVLEPTTSNWDMGLFTFRKDGEMNNKEEIKTLLSFHDIYSWAIGEKQGEKKSSHMKFKAEGPSLFDTKNISFDRAALLSIKIFIERELSSAEADHKLFYLTGIRSRNGKLGEDLHVVSILDGEQKHTPGLEKIGLFAVVASQDHISSLHKQNNESIIKNKTSFMLIYQLSDDKFVLVPLKSDGSFYDNESWIEFRKSEMIPYLSK